MVNVRKARCRFFCCFSCADDFSTSVFCLSLRALLYLCGRMSARNTCLLLNRYMSFSSVARLVRFFSSWSELYYSVMGVLSFAAGLVVCFESVIRRMRVGMCGHAVLCRIIFTVLLIVKAAVDLFVVFGRTLLRRLQSVSIHNTTLILGVRKRLEWWRSVEAVIYRCDEQNAKCPIFSPVFTSGAC